jgi:ABC-type multidrug transport system ATPase subunit
VSALLETTTLRVDIAGVPCVDGLSMVTTGDHVIVLGAPTGLFEAVSGMRKVTCGELRVAGHEPLEALRAGVLAGVPLDPPVPPTWTPRGYVEWSARLAGMSKRDARARANEALELLKMTASAETPLRAAPLHIRRAMAVAAGLATGAEVIVMEDPAVSLPEDAARNLSRLVATALEKHRWILFAGRIALESPLAMHADEAVVLTGSSVTGQGALAELATRERSYALRLVGKEEEFLVAAEARGAQVVRHGAHLTVDLGPALRTRDLLELAEQVSSVIVEMRPLARAFL